MEGKGRKKTEPVGARDYVWVLNPGAERELSMSGGHETSAALRRQMEAHRDAFAPLVRGEPANFLHELPNLPREYRGKAALLFCPTPAARTACERSGLSLLPAPSSDVLRRVHRKDFLGLGQAPLLAGRQVVREWSDFETVRRQIPGPARLKRLYGYAGKGQRTLPRRMSADDERWVRDGLKQGGVVVEPEVEVRGEVSVHGVVQHGKQIVGEPCRLEVDEFGAPRAITRLDEATALAVSSRSYTQLLRECRGVAESVAAHLEAAAYFGPFALDFLVAPDGRLSLCDWNPRFSLGWSTGLGQKRDDALRLLLQRPCRDQR